MTEQRQKKPYPLRGPSLAESHPEHASYADGWDPNLYSVNSNLIKNWKCPIGHRFTSQIFNFTRPKKELLCHVCSGRKVLAGFNDLQTLFPQIAAEADGWDPTAFSSGSNLMKQWKCKKGHRWEVKINSRVHFETGCPQCAHQRIITGETDLMTKYPAIANQAHGWNPSEVMPGSHLKRDWICTEGHVWASPVNIRVKGSGCPYCSGYFAIPGRTDLLTLFPHIAQQADGWDPTKVTVNSYKRLPWVCEKGHRWNSIVSSRTQEGGRGGKCPVCVGQRVLIGFNDLASQLPALAQEAFGWDPTTLTIGSGKKVGWRCSVGHHWSAQVASRVAGKGCPSCAKYGYDVNKDGYLYLFKQSERELLQIGITNSPRSRLPLHKRKGWELLELRGPMDGLLAKGWESSILAMLSRHGAILAPKEVAGKFDGYTEAWIASSFPTTTLRKLMDLVKDEEAL